MEDKIQIEWSYTPTDYFEEPYRGHLQAYAFQIDNGRVTMALDADTYGQIEGTLEELHYELNDFFLGAQVVSHKPYKLSKYWVNHYDSEGKKFKTEFEMSPSGSIAMSGSAPSASIDAAGNVISDSRGNRIKERQTFAELAAKYRQKDPVAESILRSYSAAVNDPANELIHLYEVRDALDRTFGDQAKARREFNMDDEWKRLGDLANDASLRQGRHRGKHLGQLQDATSGELQEARTIAKSMIHAYLKYLESGRKKEE